MAELRETAYPHITLDEKSVPVLTGTRIRVVEIVLDRLAHHWDADEIQRQHPDLGLAQIHAALAYYCDHQEQLDRDVAERLDRVVKIKARLGASPLREKLRAAARLP